MLRHSTAHVLAEAVQHLWPGTKVAIGPAIEDGFYYDFEFAEPPSESDLARIEDEMRAILARGPHPFERVNTTREEAVARFAAEGESYKVELAEGLPDGDGGHVLRARRLRRSLPWSAPPDDEADPRVQADLARGRVLARRLGQADADAHLRHGILRPGRSRGATSEGSRRHGGAIIAGSVASSTSSTSATPRPVRRSGTRAGWCSSTSSGACGASSTRAAAIRKCALRSCSRRVSGSARATGTTTATRCS